MSFTLIWYFANGGRSYRQCTKFSKEVNCVDKKVKIVLPSPNRKIADCGYDIVVKVLKAASLPDMIILYDFDRIMTIATGTN
jgi:hypothetical protein